MEVKKETRKVIAVAMVLVFIIGASAVFLPKDKPKPIPDGTAVDSKQDSKPSEPTDPKTTDPLPDNQPVKPILVSFAKSELTHSELLKATPVFAYPTVWKIYNVTPGTILHLTASPGVKVDPPIWLVGCAEDWSQNDPPEDPCVAFELTSSTHVGLIGLDAASFIKDPSDKWTTGGGTKGGKNWPSIKVTDADIGKVSTTPLHAKWGADGNFVIIVTVQTTDWEKGIAEALSILESIAP